MRKGFVNALLLGTIIVLAGCGFQLQRKGSNLPNHATSVMLEAIENKTYVAGLEWDFEAKIKQYLAYNQIRLAGASNADLSMKVNILGASVQDPTTEDTTTTLFPFVFHVQAQLWLVDLRSGEVLINGDNEAISYRMEVISSVLSEEEIRQGYEAALTQLAQKIQVRLTTHF